MLNTEPSAGLTVLTQGSLPRQHLLVGDTAETHSPIYYVTVTAARNRRKKMVYKVTKYVLVFFFSSEELRNNLPDGMALKLKLKQKQPAAWKAGGTAHRRAGSQTENSLSGGTGRRPLQLVQREQGESRLG